MTDMTPLPPACVAAVRELPMSAHPNDVARAVLDAFVAGEVEGRWKVRPSPGKRPTMFQVGLSGMIAGMPGSAHFPDEAKARGCAAILNYLEAKGE